MRYEHAELTVAVDEMASSAAPIQERVGAAFIAHLHKLSDSDFEDPEARRIFRDEVMGPLDASLARIADDRGIPASCRALTDEEAVAIATAIVRLKSSCGSE